MARAVQRPAARRDFIIHYVYLADHAGLDVAKRFRQAVESAYSQLAEMPGMGAPARVWAIDPNGPSIFTALKEQLGLHLETRNVPTPVFVIDHVEMAIPNPQ